MALVSDRQMVYQREIEKLQSSAEADSIATKTELSRLRLLIEADIQKKKQYKVSVKNLRTKSQCRCSMTFLSVFVRSRSNFVVHFECARRLWKLELNN